LLAADRIYLGNSVRGLIRAELIGAGEEAGSPVPTRLAAGS
jgi:hypothetical protein